MINYVLICLSFIILTAQNQPDKVKLALSGGGARGFAHVGVLKALEEFGIEVEEIAGVSAGALVGGLYASGYTIDEIEVLLKELISTEEIFSNYSRQDIPIERKFETFPNFIDIGINNNGPVFPSSLTGDSRLNYYLLRFFSEADLAAKHDFKNLSIPLTIIAADVFAEEAVRFSEGDLSRIVRASISIPTALPPVEIDNRFLVDGGIYNNLPTDMYSDSDYVVAANVASETFKSKEEINSVFDMMGHMINILSSKSDSLSILNWDIFIEPDLKGYTATNWFDYDSLVLLGYQAAVKTFESKGFKRKPYKKRVSSRPVRFENYKVGNLELTGSYRLTKEHIMKNLGIDTDTYFSWELMHQGINRLYAQNLIRDFWVTFEIVDGKLNLNVKIKENVLTRLGIGGYYQSALGNNINLDLKFIGRLGYAETISLDFLIGDYISGVNIGVRYNSILNIPMFDYFNFDNYDYVPLRYDSLEAKIHDLGFKYSTGLQLDRDMMILGTIGYEEITTRIGTSRDADSNKSETYEKVFVRSEYVFENLDDLYFPTSGSSLNIAYTFNRVKYIEANDAPTPKSLEGVKTFYNQFDFTFHNHNSVFKNAFIFSQHYEFHTIIRQLSDAVPILGQNRYDLTRSTVGYFDPEFYKFHFVKINYAAKQKIYESIYLYGSYAIAKEWKQLEKVQFSGFNWNDINKGFEIGIYIPTAIGPLSITYSNDDFFNNAIRLSIGFIE